MSDLLPFADMDAQYARDAQLSRADVATLDEWQRKQPHLPAPLHPIETALFLHSCYFSIEAAKRCIEAFYAYRTRCPEFFAQRDPLGRQIQTALDLCIYTALPDITPQGHLVLYARLVDCDPSKFMYNAIVKLADMIIMVTLKQRGCFHGHVGIVDMKGVTVSHLLRCPLISVRNAFMYLQTALPFRLKEIHFVNSVSFMDKVFALIRPFLSKELQDVVHVHYGDNSTIFKFVPKEMLPIECGGSKTGIAQYYNDVTRRDIEFHCNYFDAEEGQLADESKRPDKSVNIEEFFGVEGTFKSLVVD